MIAEKTIERISLYRRLLQKLSHDHTPHVYSHQLAAMAHCTPAQVRRDLMLIGVTGSPSKGYRVADLLNVFSQVLDSSETRNIALVGIGNLGRAILSYFPHRSPSLTIVAAFDRNPEKINRVIHGCRTYDFRDFPGLVKQLSISVGIITVPFEAAQSIADMMVEVGIRGILNFAPVPIRVPSSVVVEHLDVTMHLEKIAYFSGQHQS
jgi:redox-sensing transcriptional repressor